MKDRATRKMMIIASGKNKTFHSCPNHPAQIKESGSATYDFAIPEYQSILKAIAAGWIRTNHPAFHPFSSRSEDRFSSSWICPECAKELKMRMQ